MANGDLINDAKAMIGDGAKDDYLLAPKKHAQSLASSAPALAAVLNGDELVNVTDQYENSDAQAATAQIKFKSTAMRANFAVFLTVLLGAGLLAGAQLPPQFGKSVLVGLTILATLSAALATMWLYQIRTSNMLEKWMTARAEAETMRLSYFLLVTNAQPADVPTAKIPLPLLQLEYFRRYQLDLQ